MPLQTIRPTWAFVDESGGIGGGSITLGIITHPNPENLTLKLHNQYETLLAIIKKRRGHAEFHFREITDKVLPIYKEALSIMAMDTQWRFHLHHDNWIDKERPKSSVDKWHCYRGLVEKALCEAIQDNERAIVLIDWYKKPRPDFRKDGAHLLSLASLADKHAKIERLLHVDGCGVLLIQMADLLLGGFYYAGEDPARAAITKQVLRTLNECLCPSRRLSISVNARPHRSTRHPS